MSNARENEPRTPRERSAQQLDSPPTAAPAQDTDGREILPTSAPPEVSTTPEHAAPTQERYVIEEKLGEGGMGAVYRAHDRLLGRTVALKVIRPDAISPSMRARFEAEARAVARLDHPHIVKVFDVGQI